MIIYNINYDKRTVTAYFEGGTRYWTDCLTRMVWKIEKGYTCAIFNPNIIKKIVADYTLSATVKCHPSDTFDEEKGKALAKEKLNAKFNRCKLRVLKYLANNSLKKFIQYNERIVAKAKRVK